MAKVEKNEIVTLRSDPYLPQYQGGILQPSDHVIRTMGAGKGHELYDEISRDPHAFAVLQKRKLEVVSREWTVTEASDRRADKKAADLVREQLKAINFDKLTKGLMGAILKGFAVAEPVWTSDGSGWGLEKVPVRKQRRVRFTVDGEPRILTREKMIDGIEVPLRKLVVHRYSIFDDDDDPYGIGLGQVLYWPAWFKRQALAHWLRGNEKHATPTVTATYQGAYDQKRQDDLSAALYRMANDTHLIVPENVTLALLEARNAGGSAAHEPLNRYLDELMSEATLGETLSTNSGERGARSLGEVHNDVRLAIAKADADLVSQTINGTLVRWLVELNYPDAKAPTVWRDFSENEDLNDRVDRDKKIYDMGYRPETVEYINETYGGAWIEKAPENDPQKAIEDGKNALQTAFADAQPNGTTEAADTVDALSQQLDTLGDPPISDMVAAVREAVMAAATFEELETKLLELAGEIDPDAFGGLMEQAITVAALSGTEAAQNDG